MIVEDGITCHGPTVLHAPTLYLSLPYTVLNLSTLSVIHPLFAYPPLLYIPPKTYIIPPKSYAYTLASPCFALLPILSPSSHRTLADTHFCGSSWAWRIFSECQQLNRSTTSPPFSLVRPTVTLKKYYL